MTPEREALLADLRPIYDAIGAARSRLLDLRTVELARAAFEQLLAADADELERVRQRKRDLERPRVRQRVEPNPDDWLPPEPRVATPQTRTPRPSPPPLPPVAPKEPPGRQERLRLKRLVNRWAFAWGLDADRQGEVNRILDDEARPTGEVLALLEWRTYVEPLSTGEGEAAHQVRLQEWGTALREYRERLGQELEMVENRYRSWLGVWELWRTRERGSAEDGRWLAFVADKRRALVTEKEQLERAVALLEARDRAGADA